MLSRMALLLLLWVFQDARYLVKYIGQPQSWCGWQRSRVPMLLVPVRQVKTTCALRGMFTTKSCLTGLLTTTWLPAILMEFIQGFHFCTISFLSKLMICVFLQRIRANKTLSTSYLLRERICTKLWMVYGFFVFGRSSSEISMVYLLLVRIRTKDRRFTSSLNECVQNIDGMPPFCLTL